MNIVYVPEHVLFESAEDCMEQFPYKAATPVVSMDDFMSLRSKIIDLEYSEKYHIHRANILAAENERLSKVLEHVKENGVK